VILVTGATGFVGGAVVTRAASEPTLRLRVAVRRKSDSVPDGVDTTLVGALSPDTDWSLALSGVEVIVHAAARVHVMHDAAVDPLRAFRRANVDGTLKLARQAAKAGVRRFVFISSIKVHGEHTLPGQPFTPWDVPAPVDPYGISKLEAEKGLQDVANETGLEVVVIRPVLVYGPGVKANFRSLMWWLYKGVPLPLGKLSNKRSFVALDNLADLILTCVWHPAAVTETFLVSDGEDLPMTELLQRVAVALGRRPLLVPVPRSMLLLAARLMGQVDVAQRLCNPLQVDISRTRKLLGWTPPVGVDEALRRTVEHFLSSLPTL